MTFNLYFNFCERILYSQKVQYCENIITDTQFLKLNKNM